VQFELVIMSERAAKMCSPMRDPGVVKVSQCLSQLRGINLGL
jgi:hypothetical protein